MDDGASSTLGHVVNLVGHIVKVNAYILLFIILHGHSVRLNPIRFDQRHLDGGIDDARHVQCDNVLLYHAADARQVQVVRDPIDQRERRIQYDPHIGSQRWAAFHRFHCFLGGHLVGYGLIDWLASASHFQTLCSGQCFASGGCFESVCIVAHVCNGGSTQ